MALVHNKGLRGFILKSGILEAGKIANLDENEAQKLAGMYPNEIEIVITPKVQVKSQEEPKVQEVEVAPEPKEEPAKEEPKAEKKPAKKGSKK